MQLNKTSIVFLYTFAVSARLFHFNFIRFFLLLVHTFQAIQTILSRVSICNGVFMPFVYEIE